MQQEPTPQSRQIVDDIVRTYQLRRYFVALGKIEDALLHPEWLTEDHASLLRQAYEKLTLHLSQHDRTTSPKTPEQVNIPPSEEVPHSTESITLPVPGDTMMVTLVKEDGIAYLEGQFEGKRVMVHVQLPSRNLTLKVVVKRIRQTIAGPMVFTSAVPDETGP
ncbi:MAG TPA: hypothetical protein VKU00_11810 [Chthonomonadaceae bacterium]|nr:hypothetical protein [Chthonomonadaceae bacterium]